jgi:hypothetical protein
MCRVSISQVQGEVGMEQAWWEGKEKSRRVWWIAVLCSKFLTDTQECGSGSFVSFLILKCWLLHRARAPILRAAAKSEQMKTVYAHALPSADAVLATLKRQQHLVEKGEVGFLEGHMN